MVYLWWCWLLPLASGFTGPTSTSSIAFPTRFAASSQASDEPMRKMSTLRKMAFGLVSAFSVHQAVHVPPARAAAAILSSTQEEAKTTPPSSSNTRIALRRGTILAITAAASYKYAPQVQNKWNSTVTAFDTWLDEGRDDDEEKDEVESVILSIEKDADDEPEKVAAEKVDIEQKTSMIDEASERVKAFIDSHNQRQASISASEEEEKTNGVEPATTTLDKITEQLTPAFEAVSIPSSSIATTEPTTIPVPPPSTVAAASSVSSLAGSLWRRSSSSMGGPKSPAEEERLKAKYAQYDDVGERAYQILLDLGMVESTD